MDTLLERQLVEDKMTPEQYRKRAVGFAHEELRRAIVAVRNAEGWLGALGGSVAARNELHEIARKLEDTERAGV